MFIKANTHLQSSNSSKSLLAITGISDADWAASKDDRKLVGGYCVYLGDSLFSLSSRKQTAVARSSTESEYRSLSNLAAEVVWVKSLLSKIQLPSSDPAILWRDNLSAGSLVANPIFHARTKHIELDVHFICDKIQAKEMEVRYVPTHDQTADILTKSLSHTCFAFLRDKLGVVLHSPYV